MTEFFVPIAPPTVTHQEKDIKVIKNKKGKHVPLVYEPAELKAARSKLMAHFGQHTPAEKYTGGIRLTTKWLFPIPPNSKYQNGQYKLTKPDYENMVKLMNDVMTKLGFWADDCLIASGIIEKFWADRPGIYVKIEELD